MLDQLLKKLPSRSHTRSESSPHLRDSLNNSFFASGSTLSDDVFSEDVPVAPIRHRVAHGRELPHSFDATLLAEPVNARQSHSDLAKPFRRELPPLLTSPIQPNTPIQDPNSSLDTDTQDFAHSPQRSPEHSPTRVKRFSIPLLTGDHTERVKKDPGNSKLAGWFSGESEPINIGILPSPTKERADPLANMLTDKPSQTTPKPTITSRFSFFTNKPSSARPSSTELDPDDEFLNLDIPTALFPAGPADPFSPASFKNLVQNAEGLLTRLQAAYKERTISLHDVRADKEAMAEELEGATTRSKHLKIQLDDMSAKLTEQDNAMMELVDELANLKRLRSEEEDARKRSIRPVIPSISTPKSPNTSHDSQPRAGRRLRRERLSTNSTTTTDCDSEDESSASSIFSKGHSSSPRMSLSSVSTTSSPETYHHADSSFHTTTPAYPASGQAHRTPSGKYGPTSARGESLVWSCANCEGGDATEAWSVVSMLKEENKCLKERVQQVEGALEGCLDVVARLG